MSNFTATLHHEVLHSLQQSIVVLNREGRVIAVNPAWEALSMYHNYPSTFQWLGVNFFHINEIRGDELELHTLLTSSFHCIIQGHLQSFTHDFSIQINQKLEWHMIEISPLLAYGTNSVKGANILITNITKRKQLEHDLQEAISQVRTIRGLIPICAVCKRIKDDNLLWNAIEHFLEKHTHAEFTHDICPDCIRTLYPKYSSALDNPSEV